MHYAEEPDMYNRLINYEATAIKWEYADCHKVLIPTPQEAFCEQNWAVPFLACRSKGLALTATLTAGGMASASPARDFCVD